MATAATAQRAVATRTGPPLRRASLAVAVLAVCALAVLPFLALAGFAVRDAGSGSLLLGAEGF